MTITAPSPAPPRPNGQPPVRVHGARARRVPWVALGVILVLGGGLAFSLALQSAGRRLPVVVAARDISPGQQVIPADLRILDVAIDGQAAVVPATRLSELVGQTATSRIPSASVVSLGQFATGSGLAPGQVVVGALLAPGGLPVPNLRVGDRVRLLEAREAERPAQPDAALGVGAVFLVTPGPQPGTQFVSLTVDDAVAQRVADAAAAQRLRLVLLPLGTQAGG